VQINNAPMQIAPLLRSIVSTSFSLLLAACFSSAASAGPHKLSPWPFKCVHERDRLPEINPDAEQLYRYGQSIELNDPKLKFDYTIRDENTFISIARYYRIAAAHGHYNAVRALYHLIWRVSDGEIDGISTPARDRRAEERNRLLRQLIDSNIPAGHVYKGGLAQQEWNLPIAISEFRQAADKGSPEGQFRAAELLAGPGMMSQVAGFKLPDKKMITIALYQCSADQGYLPSTEALARLVPAGSVHAEIERYQQGVSAGSIEFAASLKAYFSGESAGRLGPRKPDKERARRYDVLASFLTNKQYVHPRILNIDKIVPLPPAALPEWDGTILWEDDVKKLAGAEKPSEALLSRMAQQKGLNPRTGLPVSQ
jgi:hypothetical protein